MSVSLRKSTDTRIQLVQCEGCYDPLGPYLDNGRNMEEFDILWQLCNFHYQPVSNVPFDVYDDYENGY